MADRPKNSIYLDHNATTPILPEAAEAIRACWNEPYLNPASQHAIGRRARRVLEDTRERIGELLGADRNDRVVFTSGGTESNNLAIRGLLPLPLGKSGEGVLPPSCIIISAIEHPSITSLAEQLARKGLQVDRLGVDRRGLIRVDELADLLRPETRLVAAVLAQNETGVLQPIQEASAKCKETGVPVHTDASQAAGKMPVSFRELGVATMTIAAHKFGGPVGIGALVIHENLELQPQLFGGFQQSGLRPGTESIALAVGMRIALEQWQRNRPDWLAHLRSARDKFESTLRREVPEIQVIGENADRLPNTSHIAFIGLDRQQLFLALDQAGVACSTGSACASGSSEPSSVLLAMGCAQEVISSALRFSFGVGTTLDDVTTAACRITKVCNNLRSQKLARK
jgi:cysteine desulfurase